ncbi:MAG: FtsB family cell division protein [Bryobacteraceae bacterium]
MHTAFRRLTYVIVVALVGTYAYVALRGPQGIPSLVQKRHEIHQLQEENANLLKEIEAKKQRIQDMKSNQAQQALEIRKQLHLVHPGEVTLMLPDAAKTAAAPASATQSGN